MNAKFGLLTRRTVLQGAGVAMALPWLESMSVWGAEEKSEAAGGSAWRGDGIGVSA